MALSREPTTRCFKDDTMLLKRLALSDYYFGDGDWKFPLGLIQMCATSH